ncbi:hypothetical protein ACYOEI_16015 [Singulisphaera rosea]
MKEYKTRKPQLVPNSTINRIYILATASGAIAFPISIICLMTFMPLGDDGASPGDEGGLPMGILFLVMFLTVPGGYLGFFLAGAFHIFVLVATWIENRKPSLADDWD